MISQLFRRVSYRLEKKKKTYNMFLEKERELPVDPTHKDALED